jgi:uncharacterized damage-inducible protein DinB
MKKYFLKLYQYNDWATKRVLDCLNRQSVSDEKIIGILGHVIAAQYTHCLNSTRWDKKSPLYGWRS